MGRHMVEALVARGHEVTLFSRGQSGSELFPNLPRLQGDRLGDVSSLEGTAWDAILDVSAYVPRAVDTVAEALASPNTPYVYISTISVYDDPPANADETATRGTLEDASTEVIDGATYGPLKALCEDRVLALYETVTILRPGLIVGPHDHTDRFNFWVWRFSQPGPVPVPDRREQPLQVIDARDLAQFAVWALENNPGGVFNVVGSPTTFGEYISECARAGGAEPAWRNVGTFEANEVHPWVNLPLVLPFDGSGDAMQQINSARAEAAGLTRRPLSETVADTLDWSRTRPPVRESLTIEMEARLL